MSSMQFSQGIPDGAVAITPSDSAIQKYAAIYVGGSGNLKITGADGIAVVFTAVPIGTIIKLRTRLVWDTGTTATALVGFVE